LGKLLGIRKGPRRGVAKQFFRIYQRTAAFLPKKGVNCFPQGNISLRHRNQRKWIEGCRYRPSHCGEKNGSLDLKRNFSRRGVAFLKSFDLHHLRIIALLAGGGKASRNSRRTGGKKDSCRIGLARVSRMREGETV